MIDPKKCIQRSVRDFCPRPLERGTGINTREKVQSILNTNKDRWQVFFLGELSQHFEGCSVLPQFFLEVLSPID
jgi:hypothetical protein